MHIYVNKIIGVVLDSDSQFHFPEISDEHEYFQQQSGHLLAI